jgi:hypothetical protein
MNTGGNNPMEHRPDEEEVPGAPTLEEDADLVALMRAGPEIATFYIPGTGEDEKKYWIRVRSLTGVEWDAYNAVGTQMSMPFEKPIGGRGDDATPRMTAMHLRTDPVKRFHELLKLSVQGYKLVHMGIDSEAAEIRAFSEGHWQVFKDLPRPVKDWLYDKLCDFHGIEQVEAGEAPAGDS